jgi:hypothetical protein
MAILKSKKSALINLITTMHLNERLPEFHNILINNIKSDYGSIVDENKIVLKKKDKIISDLLINRLSDLKDLIVEYKQTKHLTRTEKEILEELIFYIDNYYLENEDIDGNVIKPDKETLKRNKDIYDELIYEFYNNRLLVDNTLKKITSSMEIGLLNI